MGGPARPGGGRDDVSEQQTGMLRRLRRALDPGAAGSRPVTLEDLAARLDRLEDAIDELSPNIKMIPSLVRRLYLDGLELPPPYDLTSQRFRVSSQNEEDGVVAAIFRRLGATDHRCVEIGYGMNGGNSGFLIRDCGWSGLLMDAKAHAIKTVRRRFAGHAAVAHKGRATCENLNALLEQYGFTGELDLLSIDVDGVDYWLWKALTACRPRVVTIEYNWLFGAERAVTVPYDPRFDLGKAPTRGYRGASLPALVHLGRYKGYHLVATERVNAFFVRNDLQPAIAEVDAARACRAPVNQPSGQGDVFQKIEAAGLPLVTVTGPGAEA